MSQLTPFTGQKCCCKRGIQRDNCPQCEGTGMVINFRAIHAAREQREQASKGQHTPGPTFRLRIDPLGTSLEMLRHDGHVDIVVQHLTDEKARLIAQAPAMLEALQELLNAINMAPRDSIVVGPDNDYAIRTQHFMTQADKARAILQAIGER